VSGTVPITLSGFQELQAELRRLKSVERPAIVEAIATARSLGDLSENAEYHSAKERQGILESKIADLENKMSKVCIIDVSKITSDTVKFGATVKIEDEERGSTSSFQIVGSYEANIKEGRLPIDSPMARAIIGKKTGDSVEVVAPGGSRSYRILEIKYM
jgi:transcription elongation factor GreA